MRRAVNPVPGGPQSAEMHIEGQDNPLAGIVVRWTEWGPMWRWDVMSYHITTGYQVTVIENGILTVVNHSDGF